MTPGEEQRIERILGELRTEVRTGLTELKTILEGYPQLKADVEQLKIGRATDQAEQRGARRVTAIVFAVVQLLVSAGIIGWVSAQTP